ncbi:FkbM family methyltransferase [Phragmitibacter flavus]|uniref:FkbM family methyltransferase n=1 Tax=Phragmitibacter flavus TaxID=2576071 RepID=A0A5R8KEI3_9BACT|nr:FkbM family methyltransferase [Phragmitibacter flavus]TLD70657.1 FkbM family methyltransferase [Phragmitibacter flavus]
MKSRFLWRSFKSRFRDHVAELAVIREAVKPGEVIVDIGANKGSYLYWLSRWVGNGRVYAFEPQRSLAEYLQKACAACRLHNVTIEAKAVSSQAGMFELLIPGEGDSPGATLNRKITERENCRSEQVEVVTLDEYFPANVRIGALKIDAEGAELAIFEGAQRILAEQSPVLVFECEQRHLEKGTVQDVFEYLGSRGYQGHFIDGRILRPLQEFDLGVHQNNTGERFWDAKGYINNFVFRKR